MSAVREQGSLSGPVRNDRSWAKNVYESEVGTMAQSPLAQEIGMSFSGNERNKMFFSRAGKDFKDISAISGLDSPADGRVVSLWDYDRDGRQDLAVANSNAPLLHLYRNEVPHPGNYIALNFVGGATGASPSTRWSNQDGYGAKVRVKAGPNEYLRELRCGEGMAAQNSKTMLVGVGDSTRVDSVTVIWPSGNESRAVNIDVGTLVTFYEDPGRDSTRAAYAANLRPPTPTQVAPQYPAFPSLAVVSPTGGLRLYTTMATWCASCKAHLPQVHQMEESFSSDQLTLYGLPADPSDNSAKLADYIEKHKPAYRLLADLTSPERTELATFLKKVDAHEALPSTIVTDGENQVLWVGRGFPTVSLVRALAQRPVSR